MSSRETETLDLRHVGEVAAVVAKNAQEVLAAPYCVESPALTTYWTSSRRRADLWQYSLDDALEASRRDQPLGKHTVHSISTVISEVLATELVTRLWTAVIVGHERLHAKRQEPLARRVLNDHLTARRTSLKLLTHPIALPSAQIVALDRVRQRAERWTDCLLATLPEVCTPEEFAFSAERFREFAEDSDVVTRLSTRFSGWHLLALSLRVASDGRADADQTRIQLHREILDSIGSVIDAAENNRRFDGQSESPAADPSSAEMSNVVQRDEHDSMPGSGDLDELDVFIESEPIGDDGESLVPPLPTVEDPFLSDLSVAEDSSPMSGDAVEAVLEDNFGDAASVDEEDIEADESVIVEPATTGRQNRISADLTNDTTTSFTAPTSSISYKRVDSRRLRVENGGLSFHRVLDRTVH